MNEHIFADTLALLCLLLTQNRSTLIYVELRRSQRKQLKWNPLSEPAWRDVDSSILKVFLGTDAVFVPVSTENANVLVSFVLNDFLM